ncbi:hypothetical protein [Moorena sp. SIO2C4]|uniref:hypothetical protein n=1 Tax=Moorena sp. SIO2C4 TaxID=2607824 RepID=UPI00257AC48D|nr:hypothetical protein [Moorena sp. SIO2C4]
MRYTLVFPTSDFHLSCSLLPAPVLMQSASGGNHGSRSWGRPPLAALPPQDRAALLLPKTQKFVPHKL